MITLTDEMQAVIANLKARDWIQGQMRHGDAVCAHGAVMTCQGLQPGDAHIIRAVMRAKGVTERWNDMPGRTKDEVLAALSAIEVTDGDLADAFGPNWRDVIAVIRRAATLTVDEAARMSIAWDADGAAAAVAARAAARAAAAVAARAAARVAAGAAAGDAAVAATVSDLVGQYGLTQEHINILLAPWIGVLGENWAERAQP